MSKTSISFTSHAFYGYPKAKRTCLNIKPIFSNLKQNLTELNKQFSSTSPPPETVTTTTAAATTSATVPASATITTTSAPTIISTKAIAIGNLQHVLSPATITTHKSHEVPPKLASTEIDRASIDTGYSSSVASEDRDSPLPLKNLGNTCYENSIIQCLFSLVSFMDDFVITMNKLPSYSKDEDKDGKYAIANAFLKLYQCYTKERCKLSKPTDDSGIHTGSSDRSTPSPNRYTYKDEAVSSSDQDFRDEATANSLSNLSVSSQEKSSSKSDHESAMDIADKNSSLSPIALTSSPTGSTEIDDRLNELKSAVGKRSSQFNSTHQQDASEFFYLVIDSIQEFFQSLKQIKDEQNPVTKTFELELDYLVKCLKCHKRTMSETEKIRTLPLAIPASESVSDDHLLEGWNGCHDRQDDDHHSSASCSSSEEKENFTNQDNKDFDASAKDAPKLSLHQALLNYFRDDLMEFGCSEKGCDSKEKTRKCLIKKLPQVLFLTLARYSHTGQKNLDEIEAPFEMSVPYKENKSPSQSPSTHRTITEDDTRYQLVAFVCHLGSSLNAGHYTSYVLNQNNGSWYLCDDDAITKVEVSRVEEEARRTGYCFFYAHKSTLALPSHFDNIVYKSTISSVDSSLQPEPKTPDSKPDSKKTKSELRPLFSNTKIKMSSLSERVGMGKIDFYGETYRSKDQTVKLDCW